MQSDQITIAGYEVELNDLKGATNYEMSCIPVPKEGDQQQYVVDRLIDTPNRILLLLRATVDGVKPCSSSPQAYG
jgi:hypothetical protein